MNPHILLNNEEQIKAVESLKRVDKDGYLYYMECNYNYYDLTDMLANLMMAAGCSTFVAKNMENEYLMYRNYDYKHNLNNDKKNPVSGINVICKVNNPKAKYKSIGVADAFWLDSKNGRYVNGCADDGVNDISSFVALPFLTVDGVNEKGLSVSIMALIVKCDWVAIDYDTYEEKMNPEKTNYKLEKEGEEPDIWEKKSDIGSIAYNVVDHKAWICQKETIHTTMPNKQAVMHTYLMRMMLDNCSNVDEAIALADSVNVMSVMSGTDFHIMVADASGNSKVLEWVDNKMNVTDTNHCTNYRFSADDYFHGSCPRDEVLKAGIKRGEPDGLRQDYGELTMRLASQDPTFNNGSKTQFSCVYNLAKKTLKVFSFGDFDKSWNFEL